MNIKKIYTYLILVLTVVGLQACSSNKDDTITKNVQAKIAADTAVATQKVDVSTKGGIVTLSGTVENAQQAQAIVSLAQSVDGVVKVETKIAVKRAEPVAKPQSEQPQVNQPGQQTATEPAKQ